jgi:hypothetical protein
MLNNRLTRLAAISALVLGVQSACAQSGPTSGLYQIVSGRYIACCGIAGPFIDPLPDASDAFIELTVDLQNNLAQMKFLGQDMHTVLRIPPEPCRSEFAYVFTNGIILPDHIQFGGPLVPPLPDQPSFSFVISNSMHTLSINGTVIAPCPGSADLPEAFQHTNVVAVLMPTATIRVSEVEVCWNAASNRTYQAQYRSTLTTNVWVDLGTPVAGTGSTTCITDKVPKGQSQRYYRVLIVP